MSPSSRRAWIEIRRKATQHRRSRVALLAEGVDRNSIEGEAERVEVGRPPRGGRG